jgi:hypothetical protein
VAAIRFAKTWKACNTRCWGMYLHLRPRPMSREPAPPHCRQAPAACTGERQRGQPGRRSGSPATEPSGPVTKLVPLDRLQPTPAAHWTYGGLGGVKFPPLASLYAQLLKPLSHTPHVTATKHTQKVEVEVGGSDGVI